MLRRSVLSPALAASLQLAGVGMLIVSNAPSSWQQSFLLRLSTPKPASFLLHFGLQVQPYRICLEHSKLCYLAGTETPTSLPNALQHVCSARAASQSAHTIRFSQASTTPGSFGIDKQLFLQEAKQSMSKRKASDAASPALDTSASAAAEEISPSKRLKSASDSADPSQVHPPLRP